MPMKRLLLGLALLMLANPTSTEAHGGTQLIVESRNGYQIFVSLSPSPPSVGLGDLSIGLIDLETYQPAPAEAVTVEVHSPDGTATTYSTVIDGDPSLAIYNLHTLDFTEAGVWRVNILVTRAGATETFGSDVQVASVVVRWLSLLAYMVPVLALALMIGLAALRNRLVERNNPPPAEEA